MEFPGERITGSFETGTGSGVGVFVHPGDGLALPAGGVPWTLRFVRAARFFHNEHTHKIIDAVLVTWATSLAFVRFRWSDPR